MERLHPSTIAWGVGAFAIAAYDYWAPPQETLSEGVDRALERPIGRYFTIAAIAATAGHLLNLLPERVDPFHQTLKYLKGE